MTPQFLFPQKEESRMTPQFLFQEMTPGRMELPLTEIMPVSIATDHLLEARSRVIYFAL